MSSAGAGSLALTSMPFLLRSCRFCAEAFDRSKRSLLQEKYRTIRFALYLVECEHYNTAPLLLLQSLWNYELVFFAADAVEILRHSIIPASERVMAAEKNSVLDCS